MFIFLWIWTSECLDYQTRLEKWYFPFFFRSIWEDNRWCHINVFGLFGNIKISYHTLITNNSIGFLIAISNPLNIVFWVGIYGSVLTDAMNTIEKGAALLYSSSIFIGIILWNLFLILLIFLGRRFVKESFLKWFSVIARVALIGYGLYFGYKVMTSIFFWFPPYLSLKLATL